ncbi:hypothetical protein [Ideonella sp. BN130291]|uniref:hypothetical protein n=1 Tax=Ideonella sp. BN130291 TaxID=3112940 RepID=UPI002E26F805|nr:hypothetical protein [Ideonella sp. BN130291]
MTRPRQAAILGVTLLLLALSWLPTTQDFATEHTRQGLKRALATYAVARSLNAVISVAKGTELAAEPAGVGFTFAVGEALDPVDDVIEQFSSLMQVVLVAFGMQLLLVKLGAHWLPSLLLSLALVGVAAALLRGRPVSGVLLRLTAALLIVRFAVPVYVLGTELVYRGFLAEPYAAAQEGLGLSTREIERARAGQDAATTDPAAADQDAGWRRWLPAPLKGVQLPQLPDIAGLKQVADNGIERMVDLSVIFLLQTIVLPIAFFWLLSFSWKSVLSSTGRLGGGSMPGGPR